MNRAVTNSGLEIPENGVLVSSFPLGLSRTSLPAKNSRLFGGNFVVLDVDIKSGSTDSTPVQDLEPGSHIDVGFGDSRTSFAGAHRFEILREVEEGEEEVGGVTILYSHLSCNPIVKEARFPAFVFNFHKYYALTLFRDGIAEVLRS